MAAPRPWMSSTSNATHELRHALALCHKPENVASLMWGPSGDSADHRADRCRQGQLQELLGLPVTRTRFLSTHLPTPSCLPRPGAVTGTSPRRRDDATAVHSVCLPEDNNDRDKVGNKRDGRDRHRGVDGRVPRGAADLESGVLMSAVTVTEPLKEDPPTSMVIGQSVVLDGNERALATGEPDYALHHPAAAIRHRPDGHA